MTPAQDYLAACEKLIARVRAQQPQIEQAADWFAQTILRGQMVHLFASGHSRIMVEEMWPRYGSFPGFNPIVELSLTFHNLVVGANGQRQAMFLENVSGFAERILRNFDLKEGDSALVISSSGCNVVPVEMAEEFQRRGVRVVALISKDHSDASTSRHRDGKKLQDFADLVLDTGAPVGDAMVKIEGLETPVAPGSTVGGCLIVNAIKAEVAARLTAAGQPPKVLTAGAVVGAEKAAELFEAAYDEHARRLAPYYQDIWACRRNDHAFDPASCKSPADRPLRSAFRHCPRVGVDAGTSTTTGKVVGVHDGDTLTLLTGRRKAIKVRLEGIDAPEIGQAFGNNSKQALSEMVFGKTVRIVISTTDDYGRDDRECLCGRPLGEPRAGGEGNGVAIHALQSRSQVEAGRDPCPRAASRLVAGQESDAAVGLPPRQGEEVVARRSTRCEPHQACGSVDRFDLRRRCRSPRR